MAACAAAFALLLSISAVVAADVSCVKNTNPLVPKAELIFNQPTQGGFAAMVFKVYNPVAQGRGGGCIGDLRMVVDDPTSTYPTKDGSVWGPTIGIDTPTDCNPCYFAYSTVQGTKVTFRPQAWALHWEDQPNFSSTNTSLTVTAAGKAPSKLPAPHDPNSQQYIQIRNKRMQPNPDYDFGCEIGDPEARKQGICKICGGYEKIQATCEGLIYCAGFEMQDGADCGVLKYWSVGYVKPAVQPAKGWTAYINIESGWQERCDGCYT